MLRRSLIAVALLVAALSLAAFAAAGPARRAAFPVTVQAANGPVVVRARPTRIISLSPTGTEDLFAVGAGSQVIAVDNDSDYPKQAPRTDLSGLTPNVEAIAAYNPDLVVVSNDGGLVGQLQKVGLTVLLEPAAANLAQAYDEIRQLGEATGHDAQAATRRPLDGAAADGARPERAEERAPSHRLPRARPDLLQHDLGDVHRPHLPAVRLPQHRGRGRPDRVGLPAALGRVHRRSEPRHRRARRHRLLRAEREDGRGATRLGEHLGGAPQPGDFRQRRRRLALGPARRRLRARVAAAARRP